MVHSEGGQQVTLHLMRGISGSGKTTYAKALDAVRISRDDIRAELTGRSDKFAGDFKFEAKVTRIEQERVRNLLVQRKDVVVDDTNLVLKHARTWANMANDYGHDFEVHDLNVGVSVAAARNAEREDGVPVEVIYKQDSRACWDTVVADATHPFVDWSPVEVDYNLEDIVTCDIDGTLAILAEGFSPYDPAHYPYDGLNRSVFAAVWAMQDAGYPLVFLSGRDDGGRQETYRWLMDTQLDVSELFMRKAGDTRRDDVVKVEMFNEHIRGKYNIVTHFEDRQRVVNALRAIGITVAQVAPGDF